ncbi:glutathione transferase [Rhizoctonia solani]|uniref:Glutathione transferase n=1 Tax=Rhizoctonia solani TaxID=456999 RepID=A0A8H7H694_9AGAM|nr:glutathione transferase [Rhizoctonia solani]
MMTGETKPYVLFHSKGCGSAFSLVILRLLGIPHELVICDFTEIIDKKGPNYSRLVEANPLAQFPTLVTPEGIIMTEMVAIALYLIDQHGKETPWDIMFSGHPNLPRSTAGLYFRFVRVPADSSVDSKTVERWITEGTFIKQGEIWKLMEQEMTKDLHDGLFLLGTEKPTLLDILVALVAQWPPNPRYTWLEENCPKLVKNTKETLKNKVIGDTFRDSDLNAFL